MHTETIPGGAFRTASGEWVNSSGEKLSAEQIKAFKTAMRKPVEPVAPAFNDDDDDDDEDASTAKPLTRMNKDELLALAVERGIPDVSDATTVKQLRELLQP